MSRSGNINSYFGNESPVFCLLKLLYKWHNPKFIKGSRENRDNEPWGSGGCFTLEDRVWSLTLDVKQLECIFSVCLFSTLILCIWTWQSLLSYNQVSSQLVSFPSLWGQGGRSPGHLNILPVIWQVGLVAWAHMCQCRKIVCVCDALASSWLCFSLHIQAPGHMSLVSRVSRGFLFRWSWGFLFLLHVPQLHLEQLQNSYNCDHKTGLQHVLNAHTWMIAWICCLQLDNSVGYDSNTYTSLS